MKRNILRAAVAASILGLSGAAFADTVEVPFSGTVSSICSLSLTTDGVLAEAAPNDWTTETRGVIELAGNTGTLTVADPTAWTVSDGSTYGDGITYTVGVWDSASGGTNVTGSPTQAVGTYYVDLATTGSTIALVAGETYTTSAMVTCVDS